MQLQNLVSYSYKTVKRNDFIFILPYVLHNCVLNAAHLSTSVLYYLMITTPVNRIHFILFNCLQLILNVKFVKYMRKLILNMSYLISYSFHLVFFV